MMPVNPEREHAAAEYGRQIDRQVLRGAKGLLDSSPK